MTRTCSVTERRQRYETCPHSRCEQYVSPSKTRQHAFRGGIFGSRPFVRHGCCTPSVGLVEREVCVECVRGSGGEKGGEKAKATLLCMSPMLLSCCVCVCVCVFVCDSVCLSVCLCLCCSLASQATLGQRSTTSHPQPVCTATLLLPLCTLHSAPYTSTLVQPPANALYVPRCSHPVSSVCLFFALSHIPRAADHRGRRTSLQM